MITRSCIMMSFIRGIVARINSDLNWKFRNLTLLLLEFSVGNLLYSYHKRKTYLNYKEIALKTNKIARKFCKHINKHKFMAG